MGKPSLYAALGNKEATFLAALNLYVCRFVQPGIDLLEREPNANEAVAEALMGVLSTQSFGSFVTTARSGIRLRCRVICM